MDSRHRKLIELSVAGREITKELSGKVSSAELYEHSIALAYIYLLFLRHDSSITDLSKLIDSSVEDKDVKDFLVRITGQSKWTPNFDSASRWFSEDGLTSFILHHSREEGETPASIIELALSLLDIKEGEEVADFGCYYGSFLVQAFNTHPTSKLYGYDLNAEAVAITKIKMSLLEAASHIELKDVFELNADKRYDKTFSNYPLGVRLKALPAESKAVVDAQIAFGESRRASSADWYFNYLLLNSVKQGGRAIGIMTNGSAQNRLDASARKYFIENGLIEKVISLPAGLLSNTGIPVTLIVLSRGNKGIRFVDASDLAVGGRRRNTISPEGIKEILDRCKADGEHSIYRRTEDPWQDEWSLSASKYLEKQITLENAVSLGELTTLITRGTSLGAKALDELATDEDTGNKLLLLKDISDSRISSELPNISSIDSKNERYCLQPSDLVLSKSGAPFKVAVVNPDEESKVLASGNLYIVRLDREKIDPHYALAFLSSKVGKELLLRASAGTTIPSISVQNLKTIPIPLVPMAQQRKIAREHQKLLDEIEALKARTDKARVQVASLFDERGA